MADNFSIRGKIDIDAGPAAKALGDVSANFVKIATNARSSDAAINKAGTSLKDAAAAAKLEAKSLSEVAVAQQRVNKAYQESRLLSARATGVNIASKNSKALTQGQVGFLDRKGQAAIIRAEADAQAAGELAKGRAIKNTIALRKEEERQVRKVSAAQEEQFAHLASTRYALYDVSRTLGIAGAAMLALPAASLTVAVAWERDFARVQRTFGGTSDEVAKLRNDFVNLVQTIPEDWGALTEIGTLAGQLGIAGPQIASFTKVVAQFATTTGVSVDETATAFGRLNSLVPDVNGNYQKLADSVLSVGVNSVATEQQILKIATQLSFLGSQTTFTSDEIIGLAGALASVGVPPELSRGLVARVFGQIGRAVADSGANLDGFAKVARMSSEEFKKGWNTDTGPTFLKFMRGIQTEGTNAEAALRALGITSIRDVPVLIRLANAADKTGQAGALIEQTFRDATAEVSKGELARQYSIQAGTISAKIQLLINNFQALLNVGGQGGLGALGWLLDTLTNRLKEITKFAKTDFGGNIIGFGLVLSALAGALLLVGAAAATGVAGYMALILALKGLQAQAGGATISMSGLNGMLASTGPLGAKAAAGIRLVGVAMKALYGIGIALVLPDVAKWAGDTIYDLTKVDKTFQGTLNRFKNSTQFKVGIDDDFQRGIREAGESIGIFVYEGQRDLQRLEDGFKELAVAGDLQTLNDQMTTFMISTGWNLERILKEMPSLNSAFDDAGISVRQLNSGTLEFTNSATGMTASGEDVASVLNTIEEEAAATENAIKEAAAALMGFNGTAISAEQAEIKFQTALNNLRDAAKEADTSIDGTNDASLKMRQSFLDAEAAARTSAQAIIDNGGSVESASKKYDSMRAAIVKEIAAKTGSQAKAEAWADTILGTTSEAKTYIQQYSDKVNTMPVEKKLTVKTNITDVKSAAEGLLGVLGNFNRTFNATVHTQYITSGTPGTGMKMTTRAQGGEVRGPGTGTSDSIPALLSNGEFVMTAKATRNLGSDFLYSLMNKAQRGYATGGMVSPVRQVTPASRYGGNAMASAGFTTLDAQSIAAITNALSNMNLALYTTDRKIAESASRGSAEKTLIGSK